MSLSQENKRVNGQLRIPIKPEYYLSLAHKELAEGNQIRALQFYIAYIGIVENAEEISLNEQFRLTKLLINVSNDITEFEFAQEEIVKCFFAVLNVFPENALLLNSMGLLFFTQEEYTLARSFFEKSAAAGFLAGEKNLLYTIWNLLPRWHFRMLNDKKRNEAFEQAINKAIKEGFSKVYDIGSGCGLLSLIAIKSNKDVSVVAFEENEILSGLASKIFQRNNVSEQITLINKNSNSICESPKPCNLIVTEIFDASVFGENCLESINHALNVFISSKQDFKIIPCRVTLYATAFQCDEIYRKTFYKDSLPELNLSNTLLVKENYSDCDYEYLHRKNITFLTETTPLLTVNFYDKQQLETLVQSNYVKDIKLAGIKDGWVHGLALWFDLNLDDETSISTHPHNTDNKCWEQAIVSLGETFYIKCGDEIALKHSIIEGQNRFNIELSPEILRISEPIITFLNDKNLISHIKEATTKYEKFDLKILDNSVFPLFGLLMAKKGATAYHIYKQDCDLDFFNYLLKINNISREKMFFVASEAIDEYMVHLESPDIIFSDYIKTDGSWNIADFALETETATNWEILPKKIFLNAQLIQSEYLDFCNKIDNKNVCEFNISEDFNQFSGSEHPKLDSFDYVTYTGIETFDITELDHIDFHMETTATRSGTCNGILYWFDLEFSETNKFSTANSTHYKKCCTFLVDPKTVKEGDQINVHVIRMDEHLKVYCD